MGDPSPRRPRKPVNYKVFMGASDSEDDDFKERPSSNKSSKQSTKNRLKLVGGNKENSVKSSDNHSISPTSSSSAPPKHVEPPKIIVQASNSPKRTEFGETSVIIPEPDLSIHGISSQETVLMLSSSESILSEKPDIDVDTKPGDSKPPLSGKKGQNNRRSNKYRDLSDSEKDLSSSDSRDWGEVSKKRRKKEDLKKRKLSTNSNKNENKKLKVDSDVKPKPSSKVSANSSAKQSSNPPIQTVKNTISSISEHRQCSETTAVLVLSVEDSVDPKSVELKAQEIAPEFRATSEPSKTESSKEKSVKKSVSKTNPRISNTTDDVLSEKRDEPFKEEKTKESTVVRSSEKKPVLVKIPIWNPPSKANDTSSSKISNTSPCTGLRLGLSRRGRFKPLHKTSALS